MELNKAKEVLIKIFEEHKNKNIQTHRSGDECLGNAFEDLVGVKENNLDEADFHGIEFKSKRNTTSSLTSLFSKSPSYPKKANTKLRENYGVTEDSFNHKRLNTTLNCVDYNTHMSGYGFKGEIIGDKIHLKIKNQSTGIIEKDEYYWEIATLEKKINKKLKSIAVIFGDEKTENGLRYVKFSELVFLDGFNKEILLQSLKDGKMKIDIRLGVYLTGKNAGKTHDHGTAFRIQMDDLLKYFKEENKTEYK